MSTGLGKTDAATPAMRLGWSRFGGNYLRLAKAPIRMNGLHPNFSNLPQDDPEQPCP